MELKFLGLLRPVSPDSKDRVSRYPPPIHPWPERLRRSPRINVVGTSGCRRSTLSRELVALLELSHHEMDRHLCLHGWQGRSDEDCHSRIAAVTAGEAWVWDGNDTRTIPVKWQRVESVVWLDDSLPVTLFRGVRRAVRRAVARKELRPGTENPNFSAKPFSAGSRSSCGRSRRTGRTGGNTATRRRRRRDSLGSGTGLGRRRCRSCYAGR